MKRQTSNFCCKALYDAMFEGYALMEILRDDQGVARDLLILEVNGQFETIFGITSEGVVGKKAGELLDSMGPGWFEIYQKLLQQNHTAKFEHDVQRTRQCFWISSFSPSENQLVVLFTEITSQKKVQEALSMHEILFENAQDIILYISMDDQISNANKRACSQYGYTREQLMTMSINDIRHPSTRELYERQMQEADHQGVVFECIHVRSDGTSFPVEVSAKTTNTAWGKFRIHIIRDITRRKLNEQKIAWLATYDALTQIPNRGSFIQNLEEEIERSKRSKTCFAVMLFDIDKFKHINDHYGHETGDVVLRHVARSAQKVLRTTDQIARLGGDEFVVLQTMVSERNDIVALAERIQLAVNEPISYRDMELRVKISIGICFFPSDALEANGLLHCSDKAMYDAKHDGGGTYRFFTPCEPPCEEDRLCL